MDYRKEEAFRPIVKYNYAEMLALDPTKTDHNDLFYEGLLEYFNKKG